MVGVDDDGGVGKLRLCGIELMHAHDVFIVVVGIHAALLVGVAAHDDMRQRVSRRSHRPAAVDEIMLALRRNHRVHHDRQIARGGVLHSYRDLDTACHQAMLLVLYRASAYGHIAQDIV